MQDHELAIAAAAAGAAVVRERFGAELARVEKGGGDFATEADLAAEHAILEVLRRHRLADAVTGEESGASEPGSADGAGRRWLVDPLCGTSNYAVRTPMVATNVALRVGAEVAAAAVADPFAGEIFWTDGVTARVRSIPGGLLSGAGTRDAALSGAGTRDAALNDAGARDAALRSAGARDAALSDAGARDAASAGVGGQASARRGSRDTGPHGAAAQSDRPAGDALLRPSADSSLVDVNLDPPYPRHPALLLAAPGFSERFRPRVLSTTLALAWVAGGRRAAYMTYGDVRDSVHFSAGIALCRAAGCVVTGIEGQPLHTGALGLMVAADQETHAALCEISQV